MIITWMLYCTAVSALLGLGALALERGMGALGHPTRFAWAGALLLSAALPFGFPALLDPRVPLPPREAGAAALGALEASAAPVAAAVAPTALRSADLLLLPAWLAASAALLLAGCVLLAALRLRRLGWRRAVVAGEPVLVSPGTGPAVVGFLRGRIVLPAWALEWDEQSQRLMVEHEREHLRARDPLLFLLALAAAAVVPWNAALWWQLRRLRLAMEVDCDARVLRRRPDVRAYGLLLLELGRVAASGRIPVLALTEPPSFLERRIRTMTSRTARRRVRRAALAAALCAGTVVLAAALPAPAAPVSWGIDRQPAAADTLPLPPGVIDVRDATEKPRLVNGVQVQRLLAGNYPPVLRDAGVTGSATVAFIVGADGATRDVKLVDATHEALGEPALTAVRLMRFTPGELRGRATPARVQIPVAFTLEKTGPAAATPAAPPQGT